MNGLNDTLNHFAHMAQLPPFDTTQEGVISMHMEEGKQLFIEKMASGHVLLYLSVDVRELSMTSYLDALAQCHPRRRLPFQLSMALVKDHTHIALIRVEEERLVISLFEHAIDTLLQLTQRFKA